MLKWELYPAQDFEKYREQWDELNKFYYGSALLESRFVALLLQYFGNSKIKLAIGQSDQKIVVMTLLEPNTWGTVWTTFQPAQAPLGLWLMSPTLNQEQAIQSLMSTFFRTAILFGITQQDPIFISRPKQTLNLHTIDYISTARIQVNGTFEDYWSVRGKNLRHNLKRQRNRLEREGTTLHLDVVYQPEAIAEALSDYGRLESAGWKNVSGTAISEHNTQGAFYLQLLKTYAETGDAFIYRYFYNDRVVACDLCIIGNGIINWLKTTYDEHETTSSPAALLRQDSFEQIFSNQHINTIEFYGKVMDWHTKWSDEIRTMYHVNVYRWAGLAKLHKTKTKLTV
ncbi:GNAT family N-acetyltransferase [Chromatium okenii]|uniref:GNAT family N-acetyltransferase n=1 Tax=Chromatium okenii TaxID=61644 RepID=UPI0026ED6DD7|nr:GNAT family N-acetyltransferase [Chromatium okenii]MBV5311333.1 GNAT family N-acetyltransferase [Chromatium okenii]